MGRPTTYHEDPKWYVTLWNMRDPTFREWYVRTKRLDWRLYLKYEKHILLQRMGFGLVIASVILFLGRSNIVRTFLAWPSEDINVLMTRPIWIEKRNELEQRKREAEKQLEDSTYMYRKNNS